MNIQLRPEISWYFADEYSHKIDESNLITTVNGVLHAENPEPQTQYNSIAVIEALFINGRYNIICTRIPTILFQNHPQR